MENLNIAKKVKTPEINFNSQNGLLLISGISVHENSMLFYNPIISWVKEYVKSPAKNTKVEFKLSYLNTSSLQYKTIAKLKNQIKESQF